MLKQGIKCACIGNDEKIYIYITNKKQKLKTIEILLKKIMIPSKYIEIKYLKNLPFNSYNKINYKLLNKI